VDSFDFLALDLSELYGYSTPLTMFLVDSVRFIGQCWKFNTQWTTVAAINKASRVWTIFVSYDKRCSWYVSTYIMVSGGGTFWLHKEKNP